MAASVNVRRLSIIAVASVALIAAVWLAIRWLPAQLGSAVEARLARATGLRWRVGDLALDLTRGLALRDVTVRGGNGLEGHFGAIVVAPSLAVLLGGAGPVRADVEAASVTVPLEGSGPAAAPDAPRDGAIRLSEIRAVVHRPAVAPVKRGSAFTLAADTIDATLQLATAPDEAEPAVALDLPESGLAIVLAAGARGTARTLTATLKPGDGPPVSATARVLQRGSSLRMDQIAGTVDQAPFAGSLAADTSGPKPRIDATLRLDALALTGPGTRLRGDPVDGIAVPLHVVRLPDLAWLAGFEGQAGVTIKRLALGPVRASEVVLAARTRDGQLDLALDSATLYGGTARGRYVLAAADRTKRHEIGLALSGVRTKPLLEAVGTSGLDGAGAVRIDVGAQGSTGPEVLASAAGRVEGAVTDGRIDGLDLARAAGLTRLGGGLATRLDRLGATFSVGGGRATTDDLRLKTNLIDAKGSGSFDLANGTMDLQLKPLTVVAGGRIDVPIRIAGPWHGPSVQPDLSGLAQDPGALMEGLTNLGAGLMGGGAETPRPEGRPFRREGAGRPPRGERPPRDGIGDFLDSLIGRRDETGSRP